MDELGTTSDHGIIDKLPDAPLAMETVEQLEQHEQITAVLPMKIRWWDDIEVVTDFVIGIDGSAIALRYEDDGWIIVHEGEEVEEALFILQMYHYEFDDDVEPPQ